MRYIVIEQLLELHALVIFRYGGANGVRDIGRLEAALATQSQSVFGTELYGDIYSKAAAMMRGIIADHPFFDGNKRTGTLVALTFLEVNELRITAQQGELEDFAVFVATTHPDIETIANWLQAHSTERT